MDDRERDRDIETARAIGALEGEVRSLVETTKSGFKGINERLDMQNGRLRKVEQDSTIVMTIPVCEKIRKDSGHARRSAWLNYLIPTAVGLTVLGITQLMGR